MRKVYDYLSSSLVIDRPRLGFSFLNSTYGFEHLLMQEDLNPGLGTNHSNYMLQGTADPTLFEMLVTGGVVSFLKAVKKLYVCSGIHVQAQLF